MSALAVDTWAFAELFQAGPRADEVTSVLDEADFLFTTREVVAETFNFIARRTGATRYAQAWWDDLRETHVRVFEPPLDELHTFIHKASARGALSFTDLSLAFVAQREGATAIATGDAEFRRLGLEPLFAAR